MHIKGLLPLLIIKLVFIKADIIDDRNKYSHLRQNQARYAHFSHVTSYNIERYPLFLKATESQYHLNEGQCLSIPPKWWHWVVGFDFTISINFWGKNKFIFDETCNKNNNCEIASNSPSEPFVLNKHFIESEEWSLQYLSDIFEDKKIFLWEIASNETFHEIVIESNFSDFMNNPKNKYFITLTAYDNMEYNVIAAQPLLKNFENVADVSNLWMSILGETTTGLHYDDDDGMLCVIKGSKWVRLYPPEDTKYLYPFHNDIIFPNWIQSTSPFYYNIYKYQYEYMMSEYKVPSSELLYISLIAGNASSETINYIAKNVNEFGLEKLIYGIKYSPITGLRWEIYYYELISDDRNNEQSNQAVKNETYILSDNVLTNPYPMIKSIDLYSSKESIELANEVGPFHYWYNINKNGIISHPIFGSVETASSVNRNVSSLQLGWEFTSEALFYIGDYTTDINEIESILISIDIQSSHPIFSNSELWLTFLNNIQKELLSYNCLMIAMYNKFHTGEFALQFFTISQDRFLNFLNEFAWPYEIETYYIENLDRFELMSHEITINYIINPNGNLIPSRSSIYGML